MIIADSGSTKTTWIEVETGNKIVAGGLNPHFTSDEEFLAVSEMVRKQLVGDKARRCNIVFYGAGCGNDKQRQRVQMLLAQGFDTDSVSVETDMLGACRSVAGDNPCIVGILGTGSNACYYDGEKILYQAPSAGYILGDHGSANHIGRMLLQNYLSDVMPDDIKAVFHECYPLSFEEFIDAVYHKPYPNRFLASLAPFALKNSRYTHIAAILKRGFKDWITYQVYDIMIRSKCTDLCIVGGFAKAMETRIKRYVEDESLRIMKIVADPINGLLKYHKQHNML